MHGVERKTIAVHVYATSHTCSAVLYYEIVHVWKTVPNNRQSTSYVSRYLWEKSTI
jgi:hypothetical protein